MGSKNPVTGMKIPIGNTTKTECQKKNESSHEVCIKKIERLKNKIKRLEMERLAFETTSKIKDNLEGISRTVETDYEKIDIAKEEVMGLLENADQKHSVEMEEMQKKHRKDFAKLVQTLQRENQLSQKSILLLDTMLKSNEFISSSDSDSDAEPNPKKQKPSEKMVEKKDKSTAVASNGPDEHSFQLAKNRFATVSKFRGKVLVGIREYYQADGQLRPRRKGISLTLDQWTKLKEQIDDIDDVVKKFT